MSKYKTTGKQTLFDAENAAQKLSEMLNVEVTKLAERFK